MNGTIVAPLAGAVVVVVGMLMLFAQRRNWDAQKNDPELSNFDRVHLYRRFRRRVQMASMLAVLGLLLGLGDALARNLPPIAGLTYLVAMLLLTFWIILLAFGDMLSTRVHSRVTLAQVRQKQRELEEQLEQYRNRRANGRDSTS